MMKNKRLLALLLALVLTLSALPTAWAAETADPTATDPAVETSEAATDPTQESTEATAETTAPTEGSDDRNEAVRTDPEVSHVDRTGKVENGDMLYTKPDVTSESYKVWGIFGLVSYAVKVEEHFVVGDTEWYRFSNDGILNETTRGKYSYVKAENVTLDEETAETTEPTEETTEPSEPVEDDSGYESAVETFTGSTENISVAVMADEDVFPDGTVMSVFETTVDESAVIEAVEELTDENLDLSVLGMYAVDISFKQGRALQQPADPVTLHLEIPSEDIPDDANMVAVVHMGASGAEVVGQQYLKTGADTQYVSVQVDGFSSYAAVYVNGKYQSRLLRDVLAEDKAEGGNYGGRYSIKTFDVDLFDYDPTVFNNEVETTIGSDAFFFLSYGDEHTSSAGINNSDSGFAKQGIVANRLSEDGYPIINYVTEGKSNGEMLFSDTVPVNGKTIYNDIPFEFVYDSQTGYYEYKSSANHAQYNTSKNIVELYADTLSTQNSYIKRIDFQSDQITVNDIKDITKTSTSYKATTYTGDNDTRHDPYIHIKGLGVEASQVDKVYIRAKISESVNANEFKLYFATGPKPINGVPTTGNGTGIAEVDARVFRVDYTPNGDWIEFVIDTSDLSDERGGWNDYISEIRLDFYDNLDSKDNSTVGKLDVTKEYPIEVAEIAFINTNPATTTYGGFYPFSKIEDSYLGNSKRFSLENWNTLMEDSGLATQTASRAIGNPSKSTINSELAFATVLEFDFYIPVDKSGEDLTYYFNGDDDLWVFVDNQLVLDIGGGHGAITGELNFSTGKTSVEKAVKVTGYETMANITGTSTTIAAQKSEGTLDTSLTSAGKHTMKVFYMERAGSVANCYMKFNLPQTPEGDVLVTKDVKERNNADNSVLNQEGFEFLIEIKDLGENSTTNKVFVPYKGEYTVTGVTGAMRTENGKFTLKNGESAAFVIDENYEVKVTEIIQNGAGNDEAGAKEIVGYDHVSTTVNGTTDFAQTQTTIANQQQKFDFVNIYDEKEVIYTYVAVNPSDCPTEMLGKVKLTNAEDATYTAQSVSETIGSRTGTAVGSIAQDTDAVKFVGWYSDSACENLISSSDNYVPQKENDGLYAGGTFYAKFEYMYGDLKITKSGISDLDHHGDDGNNKQEQQSTIYTVKGTSYSGVEIDMEVAIVGTNSVTIKHLPVGNYTVTEKTDWSWRYDLATGEENSHTVVIKDGDVATTEFKNERIREYWLSGDNYWKNFFNGETPNPAPTASPTT